MADRGLRQVQARCSARDAPFDIHPVEHHEEVEVESIQMNGFHNAPCHRANFFMDGNVERLPTSVNHFIRSVIVKPRRDCQAKPGVLLPPLRGRDGAVPLSRG